MPRPLSSESVKNPSEGEGTESKAMAEDNAGKSLPRKPRLLPSALHTNLA